MRLTMGCTSCRSDILIKSSACTKQELKDEYGEYIKSRCSYCGTENITHVNRVWAQTSTMAIIIAIALSVLPIVIVVIIMQSLNILFLFLFGIGGAYYITKRNQASLFNRSNVRRK